MSTNLSQKQAFFFTIINYFGILIGIVSTLFIYPKNKEMLGMFRYVEALAQLLYPILLLGASQALINFNPKLSAQNKKLLFNYGAVSILVLSFLVFFTLFIATFFPFLVGLKYVYFAFPIAIFLAFIELFKKQSTILQQIALPTFFDNIIPKIALPILFLLFLNHYFTPNQSLFFYVVSYGIIFLFLLFYVVRIFKPIASFNFKPLFSQLSKSEYFNYSLFAFAGSLGSVVAFRIDVIMIKNYFSMATLGTFSIGVTLASALAIPATGTFVLYAPKIANYLKENDLISLEKKYKEVAKLLFFIGALLYSGIFLGIADLFSLLPTERHLSDSIPIILLLGFNVLINMGTGFNGEIISYSKYYKFSLGAILLLGILNISLNWLFISYFKLGIESVAIASLISLVAFNMFKLVFIYKKFGMLPFDISYVKLIAVFSIVLFGTSLLPDLDSILFTLLYKLGICFALNLFCIYQLKLVYQFNFWVNHIFKLNANDDKQMH